MVKVFIKPGEDVEIHIEGSDGAFAVHYDTPAHPKSLVVKEIAGLPGSHKGKANELLYIEHFGYIKANPEIGKAISDDDESDDDESDDDESDDDGDEGSVEYFGEIDDELVKVHDAAAAALVALDGHASDMEFCPALKLHLQGTIEIIAGLPVVELDMRQQASTEKVQHEKPAAKSFDSQLAWARTRNKQPK